MAQNKMTIRKGDTVKVITGKDRGKTGKVLRSVPEKSRVVVEKVNMVKKAMRPTQQNPQGGISSLEAPIHVSNVMLVCPSCGEATRVARRRDEGKLIELDRTSRLPSRVFVKIRPFVESGRIFPWIECPLVGQYPIARSRAMALGRSQGRGVGNPAFNPSKKGKRRHG